ncbi:MAG: phosphate ABC transporter permease subunit PstC [Bacteroidales bacterium]|nr:phosphate ABC transporter permease subunit PstC [Bacteroidales bacterium]
MILQRKIFDKISNYWMKICLAIILVFPFVIIIALYIKSIPLMSEISVWKLIFSSEWSPMKGNFGFWPFIVSSIYVTFLSFIFAAPVCFFSAIYLTQYASKRLINFMHPVIDILAGLPSVIYGVWGILVVVPFVGKFIAPAFGISSSGYTILAGGIVLAIMCVPYMLNMLIESFKSVPIELKEASLSLGATYWESIKKVIVRKSFPGIFSSFGLGITKAFGETIAVMMVVGNMVQLKFNPLEAGYPLPALIANNYGEMLSIPKYDAALMFAALLLLVIILIINMFFRYFIHKSQTK